MKKILRKYLTYLKDRDINIDSYNELINIDYEKLLKKRFVEIFPSIICNILFNCQDYIDYAIINISSSNETLKVTCMFICENKEEIIGRE